MVGKEFEQLAYSDWDGRTSVHPFSGDCLPGAIGKGKVRQPGGRENTHAYDM